MALALALGADSARAERLPVRHYTTDDGLPTPVVISITRDSKGFLWFATRDGLSRFDGMRFTTYTPRHGLPVPTVNHLIETRSGEYVVATNGAGIARFNLAPREPAASGSGADPRDSGALFTASSIGSTLASNRVDVLYEDRRERLWAVTDAYHGIFVREAAADGFRPATPPDRERWIPTDASVLEDVRGHLWFGTTRGLLDLDPAGGSRLVPVLSTVGRDQVDALLEDRRGRVWIGHHAGLLMIDGGLPAIAASPPDGPPLGQRPGVRHFTIRDGLAGNGVLALAETPDGRIWIGTSGGLAVFEHDQLRPLGPRQGVPAAGVASLCVDVAGDLWVAADLGAYKVTVRGLVTYDAADGLPEGGDVHAIFDDRDGHLMVVSGNYQVSRFDGRRFHTVRPRLPADAVYTWQGQVGFLAGSGDWWMLSTEGVYRFANASGLERLARIAPAVLTARDGLPYDNGHRMFEDSRGRVWISSRTGGVALWNAASNRFDPSIPELRASRPIMAFAEDRAGNIWLASLDTGLARVRDTRLTRFAAAEGVPAGPFTALHVDREGRLWAGTESAGLVRVDDPAADRPVVTRYTTTEGLSTDNIRCITEDLEGRIYLGTVRGVDRLDPSTGAVNPLTVADGLGHEFVTAAWRDRSGSLWFGTRNGLSRLVPSGGRARARPPIWITALRVGGAAQPVSPLGQRDLPEVVLPPGENQVEIELLGVSYGMGERLRYQYRLEGTGANWSAPTDQRLVTFAALAPGAYRFVAHAVAADGATSEVPATVALRVLAPFWARWWFVTAVALLVAAIGYQAHRVRVGRLLDLERVRTRIAADLHDDIGSNLSKMTLLTEVVQRDAAAGQAVQERLASIASIAAESIEAMADIVWATDPSKDRVDDLVQRIRRFAEEALGARGIHFTFDTPADRPALALGADLRRQVLLVAKEAINNIVRHAHCRSCAIRLQVARGTLTLTIVDDGRGFDPEDARGGHGLDNMRKRAEALGGVIAISSAVGSGTRIELSLPVSGR